MPRSRIRKAGAGVSSYLMGRPFKPRQALSVVLQSLDVSLQLLRRRNWDDPVGGADKVL